MRLKLKERRPVKAAVIKLNRSTKLERKNGFYDGKPIWTRYIQLAAIEARS